MRTFLLLQKAADAIGRAPMPDPIDYKARVEALEFEKSRDALTGLVRGIAEKLGGAPGAEREISNRIADALPTTQWSEAWRVEDEVERVKRDAPYLFQAPKPTTEAQAGSGLVRVGRRLMSAKDALAIRPLIRLELINNGPEACL